MPKPQRVKRWRTGKGIAKENGIVKERKSLPFPLPFSFAFPFTRSSFFVSLRLWHPGYRFLSPLTIPYSRLSNNDDSLFPEKHIWYPRRGGVQILWFSPFLALRTGLAKPGAMAPYFSADQRKFVGGSGKKCSMSFCSMSCCNSVWYSLQYVVFP